MMLTRVLCLSFACLLCSCGEKKTTDQLADEMIEQVETLPGIISSVKDKESADSAATQIESLQMKVSNISKKVKKDKYLARPERVVLERRLMAVQDESAHLLKQLRGKPALLLRITGPLAELGKELERAKSVMKAPK